MFEEVYLYPKRISDIPSRDKVDTSLIFAGCKLDVPIIAAPMPDVVSKQSLHYICKHAYGFSHRFQSVIDQLRDIADVPKNIGCSIPTKNYQIIVDILAANHIQSICIDTANAGNKLIHNVVKYIQSTINNCYITTGNVVSSECLKYLRDIGVYAARLGIGLGRACTTRYEAGIYRCPIKMLKDCYNVSGIIKILDGGIESPSDMVKAIALGADAVMIGGGLAACINSPADKTANGTTIFRGSASSDIHRGKSQYTEGKSILMQGDGETIQSFLLRYRNGLRSGMSYMGCSTLDEFIGILYNGKRRKPMSTCKLEEIVSWASAT